MYRVHRLRAAGRPAVLCTVSGGTLALGTFTIGLLNAASVKHVMALALASAAMTITGLIYYLASDLRRARRRGFQLGFRVGVLVQRESPQASGTAAPKPPSQLSVDDVPPDGRRGPQG
jgi:hypothetical protein